MAFNQVKVFEVGFVAIFSAVLLCVFYSAISMNGLVLGNDPAIHLERARMFLESGHIPLNDVAWYPPLYHIILSTLIAFTGVNSIEGMLSVMKLLTALVDWLLVFSVYLVGRSFSRKTAYVASVFMIVSFPVFEINFFGGYTGLLGLACMVLLFFLIPLSSKGVPYTITASVMAFSLVLSHQLAAFVAAVILLPFVFFLLLRSRGLYLKTIIGIVLGGGAAFFIYYLSPIIAHLDVLVEHVFFQQKAMLYQVSATTLDSFLTNFGFIFFFAFAGCLMVFFRLHSRRKSVSYLLLLASFLVPLILSQSHFFGLYLPFSWFIYFLLPPMVVVAALFFSFVADRANILYLRKKSSRTSFVKIAAVLLVFSFSLMLVFRAGVVYDKIMEASVYYSTSDLKGYEAGLWLRRNLPDPATVVVTRVPGSWFGVFSGKTVIAQTDQTIDRIVAAEAVLDLSYELENSVTLIRSYEAKGGISNEEFVSVNKVWERVSYSSAEGDFVSYSENGVEKKTALSSFDREIVFDDGISPGLLKIHYFNNDWSIVKTIVFSNDSYSADVIWTVSPQRGTLFHVDLYTSIFFDLRFSFTEAFVPGVLNFENPWTRPSSSHGRDWAVVNFSSSTLVDNYLSFLDEENGVTCALELNRLPDWGNVGALANSQIDALRLQYGFDLETNRTASLSYRLIALSESSLSEVLDFRDVKSLFKHKPSVPFVFSSRDYRDYIRDKDVGFIVYDRNELDTKIVRCRLLELVFSNDRYVVFKIKSLS